MLMHVPLARIPSWGIRGQQDKDERDEQDSLIDLYLRAMENASSQPKAA